jgi:5-methylcytosine-specific restriction enzyme subunit McrC
LSRFLRENLTTARIEDEFQVRNLFDYAKDGNPKRRQVPRPRPDYAVFCGRKLAGFVDAKYRELWARDLPPAWLYQLSIYALAAPTKLSIILYPSTDDSARDQKIEIHPPFQYPVSARASVWLRPVPLERLAELVGTDKGAENSAQRHDFAEALIRPFSVAAVGLPTDHLFRSASSPGTRYGISSP